MCGNVEGQSVVEVPSLPFAALAALCLGSAAVAEPEESVPPVSSGGASAQAETNGDPGLTMIPARCFDASRAEVPLANITVFHNKIATFPMNSLTLRSEIRGGTVLVTYSDEPAWQAIFQVLNVANYRASDARVYHGTMAGRPILIWEEMVENYGRRAGIVEYRGRALFPVCDGLIHTPEELRIFRELRRQQQ
jgi:hypothetical protein